MRGQIKETKREVKYFLTILTMVLVTVMGLNCSGEGREGFLGMREMYAKEKDAGIPKGEVQARRRREVHQGLIEEKEIW